VSHHFSMLGFHINDAAPTPILWLLKLLRQKSKKVQNVHLDKVRANTVGPFHYFTIVIYKNHHKKWSILKFTKFSV
jgi:hypothetical protein